MFFLCLDVCICKSPIEESQKDILSVGTGVCILFPLNLIGRHMIFWYKHFPISKWGSLLVLCILPVHGTTGDGHHIIMLSSIVYLIWPRYFFWCVSLDMLDPRPLVGSISIRLIAFDRQSTTWHVLEVHQDETSRMEMLKVSKETLVPSQGIRVIASPRENTCQRENILLIADIYHDSNRLRHLEFSYWKIWIVSACMYC